jgi:hypothetical protein
LTGREVMESHGMEPQVVLTTPLLLSWDGEKMSSSVGNNIPLTSAPEEMFGRTMRLPDELLPEWYRLVWERRLEPDADPMQAKLALARFIVERSHGAEAAARAEEHFTRVVREHQAPDEAPPRGGCRPGRKTPIHALPRRLTQGSWLLSFPGCPIGRRKAVPDPRDWSALRTQRIRRKFPSIPGPLARVGGFFTSPSSAGL